MGELHLEIYAQVIQRHDNMGQQGGGRMGELHLEIYAQVIIIIISCHQTVFFHLSAHSLPVSLNSRRSSKVQGRVRSEHCNKCAVFSVASPHTHVVSPS